MKQGQVLLLTSILAAMLVMGYFAGIFGGQESTVKLPNWGIKPEEIDAIEIRVTGQDTLKLLKGAAGWHITSPQQSPADSLAIVRLLDQIVALKPESIVANSPDRYAAYGVASSARTIVLTLGKNTRTLILGNTTVDGASFFLRIGNDPQVIQARGNLSTNANVSDWRSTTVLRLPISTIQRISVSIPDEKYEVVNSNGRWQLIRNGIGTTADTLSTVKWLRRLGALKADAFVTEVQANALKTEGTHLLRIQTTTGQTRELVLKESASGDVLGTLDGIKDVFRLSPTQLPLIAPESGQLSRETTTTSGTTTSPPMHGPTQTQPLKKSRRGEEGEEGLLLP
ncbi:MAG: DUF4340 domain-containing protein [Bacteroidetes Order II. Incertae sedis bacterium]|nr:DUF4340 domain-containing protein [Bacteroidetes Order II. bacterium]